MARKSAFGKISRASWTHKLDTVIGAKGGQQKLADQLGVNVRTVRRWLKGETSPDKKYVQTINRMYGQNKTKKPVKPATSFTGLNVMSLESYINEYYPQHAAKLAIYIPNSGKSWARYDKRDPYVSMWLNDAELNEPYTGKPPNARGVRIIAIETDYYNPDLVQAFSKRQSFRLGKKDAMGFDETKQAIENSYYSVPLKRKRGKKVKPGQTIVQQLVAFFFGGVAYEWEKNGKRMRRR